MLPAATLTNSDEEQTFLPLCLHLNSLKKMYHGSKDFINPRLIINLNI
jgi:hypothetical protein